jgi:uncharacterized protein
MRVSALLTYPVKGCRAVALERASLDQLGLENDRRFVLVGQEGVAITQRDLPLLATIAPQVGAALHLDLGGLATVAIPFDRFSAPAVVDVWGKRVPARAADEIDALNDYLGARVRIAMLDSSAHRSFADSRPVLVATAGMLARLALPGIPMDRFRPNVVLDGELDSRRLQGDQVALEYDKPCGRCEVTTIDQASGARRGPEPLRTLNERFGGNFGIYYRVARPGALRRGEALTAS